MLAVRRRLVTRVLYEHAKPGAHAAAAPWATIPMATAGRVEREFHQHHKLIDDTSWPRRAAIHRAVSRQDSRVLVRKQQVRCWLRAELARVSAMALGGAQRLLGHRDVRVAPARRECL